MSYVIELTPEERQKLTDLLADPRLDGWHWRESLLRKLTAKPCVVFDEPPAVEWHGYEIGGEG